MAEGYQFATREGFSYWVKKLFREQTTFRLSQSAMETLSIIAYKQPILRADVEVSIDRPDAATGLGFLHDCAPSGTPEPVLAYLAQNVRSSHKEQLLESFPSRSFPDAELLIVVHRNDTALYEYLQRLGFGRPTGVDLPTQ